MKRILNGSYSFCGGTWDKYDQVHVPIFEKFLHFHLHPSRCMYVHLNIRRSPVFVIGLVIRHDPLQFEVGAVIAVCCSSYCNTVVVDTLWRGCSGKQGSQEQRPGCRMGYRKQETSKRTGSWITCFTFYSLFVFV